SLLTGLVIVGLIVVMIVAAPLLTSYSSTEQDANAVFAHPSSHHLMGADAFGRDVFSRVLYGGRRTVLACLAVVILGCTAGTILGLIAGYFGRLPGLVIMRVVDLLLAFPGILFALAVAAVLGTGLKNGVYAVAIVSAPVYARVVEGAVREIRHLPYVD